MEEGGEGGFLALVKVAEGDLDAAVDGGFAAVEEVEGLVGLVIESVNLAFESFGFVTEVLFEGGEVVGEFLPEEGAAGHEGGLALEVVKAGLSQLAQLAGIGDGPHGGTDEAEKRKP